MLRVPLSNDVRGFAIRSTPPPPPSSLAPAPPRRLRRPPTNHPRANLSAVPRPCRQPCPPVLLRRPLRRPPGRLRLLPATVASAGPAAAPEPSSRSTGEQQPRQPRNPKPQQPQQQDGGRRRPAGLNHSARIHPALARYPAARLVLPLLAVCSPRGRRAGWTGSLSMAEGFGRWESDPLFPAAECVQDSADRMEGVYRLLLHERKAMQDSASDAKFHAPIQYERDVITALGTTKWQLEQFEREVNAAAFSDKSKSRENAILKFKQFIRAIAEQISQVEESLENLSISSSRTPKHLYSNEYDGDGLASFLSGTNKDDHVYHSNGTDEIVELKLDNVPLVLFSNFVGASYKFDMR
nr:unnamed protein product [Digitaria exilis]